MNYRIRVRKHDWEIEIESEEKEYVETKFKELHELLGSLISTKPGPDRPSAPAPTLASDRRLSLVEFKRMINPDSGTENAVTVAYYLEKVEGLSEFSSKQLIEGLKEVKCNFKNYSDVVSKTKNMGFIMEGSSKKSFRLTETGERWVQSKIPAESTSNV